MRLYEHAKAPERRSRPAVAELPVLFDSLLPQQQQQQPEQLQLLPQAEGEPYMDGAGHRIEVYLSDTIQEFLTKLSLACKALALQWEQSTTVGVERATTMAYQYKQASDCAQYAVLAFVPAAEQPLSPLNSGDGKDPGASLMGAHDDPSSWLPLDPVSTFGDYANRLGLGSGTGTFLPLLRVTPASRGLRLRNHRFRQFVQERMALEARPEDVDEEDRCFAYARYTHTRDGGSTEWRPCLARRCAELQAAGRHCLSVSWAFHPPLPVPGSEAVAAGEPLPAAAGVILEESAVLLAPVLPRLLASQET